MTSEVLIIGGGVIGLSIARELHKRGVARIAIVDRAQIGGEASWAAAGMLAPNIETDANEDFHRFGIESLELYPDFAAGLLEETDIDIALDRSGTLCLAFDESEAALLRKVYEHQKQRNVRVGHLAGSDVRVIEEWVSPSAHSALLYPNDWQVDNRRLVTALRRFAEINSIRIIENAEVSELLIRDARVEGAKTSAGDLRADRTILATGAWTSLIKIGDAEVPIPIRPVRGQMISVSTGDRRIGRVIYGPRGYIVPRADGRVLIGATVEDVGFDKSTTADGIASLREAGAEIIPRLADFEISEQWAGLRPYAEDGLPVIGDLPAYANVLVATAHYRNGILLAPKTAQIVSDLVVDGLSSTFLELYGVGRFPSAARATVS